MTPQLRENRKSSLLRNERLAYPPVRLTTVRLNNSRPINFFQVLRKRKWQLLGCLILGALAGALAVWRQPYVYQARVLLELEDLNQNVLNSRDVNPSATLDNSSETYINTEAQILQSGPVFESVAQKLNEDGASAGNPWDPPLTAQEIARSVRVRTHETDRIVELSVDSQNPGRAAAIANTITSQFVEQDLKSRVEAGRQTSAWLSKQLSELGGKLRQSEQDLQAFTAKENLLVDSADGSVVETGLRQDQEELARAQADRIAKQAALEGLKQTDSQSGLLGDPTLQQYQVELTTLRKQLADLETTYAPGYYKIPPVRAQIAAVEQAYESQRQAVVDQKTKDYRAAELRENMLRSRYDQQFSATAKETANMVQYNALKSAVDLNRNIYSEMLQKAESWGVASAMQTSNVRIVEPASVPLFPSRPNKPLITALTAMGFLFAGIVWVLSRAASDTSIQEPGEAQHFMKSPELGVIPSANSRGGRYGHAGPRSWLPAGGASLELAAWDQSLSPMAESFRSTIASLLLPSKRVRVILITSLNAGDGKTTVASNLAIALTGSTRRVLLIDGDRRRGRLHTVYSRPNDRGLSDLLEAGSSADVSDFIHSTSIPNLFVLPSGKTTPATADLLYSDKMESVIAQCRRGFDLVVIDTPPVLQLPDARIIGRLSDGIILVLRAGRVRSETVIALEQRLHRDGVPVMGTILNDWNPRANGYGVYPQKYW